MVYNSRFIYLAAREFLAFAVSTLQCLKCLYVEIRFGFGAGKRYVETVRVLVSSHETIVVTCRRTIGKLAVNAMTFVFFGGGCCPSEGGEGYSVPSFGGAFAFGHWS